ncbi:hypothetical protein [Cellulosimicrobium cellulans]|uniref:hypothetical protein n=1 Tax=Cellulosimicrobium cellulans TaxID=1710 RepID=UPI00382F1CA0
MRDPRRKVYPTLHNAADQYGLPTFDVREQKLYPTVHNSRFSYGLPSYDRRA